MKHTRCYQKNYPRPQFVRKTWEDLNGVWKFAFGEEVSEEDALKGNLTREICVPFSYETEMSGIGDTTRHAVVWYQRKIEGIKGKRTILHIEGADYLTRVYVNGVSAGEREGAYSRISFDITDCLTEGENVLTVRCDDDNSPVRVRGKQRWMAESYGCWYVQTTGIWKSVWLERIDPVHLTGLKITPDLSDYSVKFDFSVSEPSPETEVRFQVYFDGKRIQSASVTADETEKTFSMALSSGKLVHQAALWSVEAPYLYDLEVQVFRSGKQTDLVESYFALRDYRAQGNKILLNGRPFYSRLLLDQGYWRKSGLTPPSEEALAEDIRLAKEMGFNGVRKHQKTEDERFFYYADVMGFTVWCELPSNHWQSDGTAVRLTEEWLNIVRQFYNHPSLVTWVVFNESWGVRNISCNSVQSNLATGLYYLTKSIDPMRPVISNDGWEHAESDILTLHDYEQSGKKFSEKYSDLSKLTEGSAGNSQPLPYANGYSYRGQPIMISEFGGSSYRKDSGKGWGYGDGVGSDEEFLERFGSLVSAVDGMGISGFCYTQITDVQQEVNGLLTEDRAPKVPLEEIAKRNKR